MAGITRQAAHKAISKKRWQGHTLEVRQTFGRGGKRGLSYQVALSSLPEAAQDPLSAIAVAAPSRPATRRQPAPNQGALIGKRWGIIEPILACPPRTAERAAALRAVVASSRKSKRTLERWVENYEEHGFSGLGRAKPSNAGEVRVMVSRPFDAAFRAAGYPDELLDQVGAKLVRKIRGIWQSPAERAGVGDTTRRAEFELLKLCEELSINVPVAALRLSRGHVKQFASDRVINVFKNDRKAFEDAKPRITRIWTNTAPMELVIADVKHVDVVMTRPDGSEVWPKVIGFMDGGTSRVFLYPVMLPKGEGVRQEHVTEAFLAMVADPWWGFPSALYLDNGSEFKHFVGKVGPALALLSTSDSKGVINAKAYNASAKPIENAFGRLDKYLFSMLPGYAGGDRMNKKTQKVGRPTAPYPGSWEDFTQTLADLLIGFNARPIGGQWGNRSPRQWVSEKAAAGWQPVIADPQEIDSAFCDFDTRVIKKGIGLSVGGNLYQHDELDKFPAGVTVALALPWRRGAMPLFKDDQGSWHELVPAYRYAPTDRRGAEDAHRRQANQRKSVLALTDHADAYDPVAASLDMARRLPALPSPKAIGNLGLSGEMRALAEGQAAARGRKRAEAPSEAARKLAAEDALIARLEAGAASGKGLRRAS